MPEKLETEEDLWLAAQHYISEYHLSINTIRKMYGYEARQRTLYVIFKFLEKAMGDHVPLQQIEDTVPSVILFCANNAETLRWQHAESNEVSS